MTARKGIETIKGMSGLIPPDHKFIKIIGKKIKNVFISEDYLIFEIDGEPKYVQYTVEGDCCSHSVFYDFYNATDLIGKTITDVTPIELELGKDSKNYQEEVEVYGYQIKTGNPTDFITFSFRNYSNGYYGGYIVDSYSENGYGQLISQLPENIQPITTNLYTT